MLAGFEHVKYRVINFRYHSLFIIQHFLLLSMAECSPRYIFYYSQLFLCFMVSEAELAVPGPRKHELVVGADAVTHASMERVES